MRTLAVLAAIGVSLSGATATGLPSHNERVIGPFTVTAAQIAANWDPVENVGEATIIASLPAGTMIRDFWQEVPVAWDGAGPHWTLAISSGDTDIELLDTRHTALDLYTADPTDGGVTRGPVTGERRDAATVSVVGNGQVLPARLTAALPVAVCVWDDTGPPTTGVLRVYIEIVS